MIIRQSLAEVVGTFILIFAGTGAAMVNNITHGTVSHAGVAIVWGLLVMSLVYALGEYSGAHLNPAVTIGFWLSGRFRFLHVIPYLVAQLFGALLASAMLRGIFGNVANLGATIPAGSDMQSFWLEIVLGFMLMFVVLRVSHGSREVGMMAGIAVGGVVGFEAMFAGPISGASMNPARSLAPAIVSGNLQSIWVYLTAPVIGVAIAVVVSAILRPGKSHA